MPSEQPRGTYNTEAVEAKKRMNPHFEPDLAEGRHEMLERFKEWRERLKSGDFPHPEKNWEVIWALTGPDETLEEGARPHKGEEHKATDYNQTRRRFETALAVAREVTAVRLNKNVDEVTHTDMAEHGPIVYWNGKAATNDYLRELIRSGEFEKQFGFPAKRIRITENRDILHTNHQLAEFPVDLLPEDGKVTIVSDVYHLPRVEENLKGHPEKFNSENTVLFPSLPSEFPSGQFGNIRREVKHIPEYKKRGVFSENEIKSPKQTT